MLPPSHAAAAVMHCGISLPVAVNETPRGKAEPSARKDMEASETNKPRERGIPRLTAGSEASRPTLDAYRCNGGSRNCDVTRATTRCRGIYEGVHQR